MGTDDELAALIPLPHPARVAATIVRLILATHEEDDPRARHLVACAVVEHARGHGQLRKEHAAGVGGIPSGGDTWWLAPMCLRCCWMGEITSSEDEAAAGVASHRC